MERVNEEGDLTQGNSVRSPAEGVGELLRRSSERCDTGLKCMKRVGRRQLEIDDEETTLTDESSVRD